MDRNETCEVWSPIPRGSGAIVVHRQLAERLPGYCVRGFDPRNEFFPPLLIGLRNAAASIVHATPDHGALLAHTGQPLIITFHNFLLDEGAVKSAGLLRRLHYRTDLRWLTQRAVKRAAAITAVSHFTAGLVESFFELKKPVRVIENGIDTDIYSPAPAARSGTVRVLVSGNASHRKGTHLIGAIARHLAPGVEIALTLEWEELVRWVGDLPNVIALGKQSASTMPAIYREADILLMPTAREGFGLAVAEAMATGLPVVASDTSTMPELVEHGEGGYLCALESASQFADRINQLATAPDVRRRMGEFNRQRVQQCYSMNRMVEGYRAVLDEVIEDY